MTTGEAIELARDLFGTRDVTNVWTDTKMLRLLGQAQRVFMGKLGQLNQNKVLTSVSIPVVGASVWDSDGLPLEEEIGETLTLTLDTVSCVLWYPDGDVTKPGHDIMPAAYRHVSGVASTVGTPREFFCKSDRKLWLYLVPYPSSSGLLLVMGQPRLTAPASTAEEVCGGLWPELHDLIVWETCHLMAVSSNDRITIFSDRCEGCWQLNSALIAMNAARAEEVSHGDYY